MAKIHRHEIPADGRWYTVGMCGDVLATGSRRANHVEFWFMDDPAHNLAHQFCVLQTGDEMPSGTTYVDATVDAGGYFIWHLIERQG